MDGWLTALACAGGGLLALWLALLVTLWVARPDGSTARELLRLLPDLLRLLRRLASDRELPRGVRVRIWLAIGYLALPIDLVPDLLPVVGWLDDVVVVTLVLRSAVRVAGPQALRRHWTGTPEGLRLIGQLTGLQGV